MKKTIYFLALSFASLLFYACQKDFLQVPDTTGTVDVSKVFSTKFNAEAALFDGYQRTLGYGNPNGGYNIEYSTIGSIAGERGRGWPWHPTYQIANGGITSNQTIFNYGNIYTIA
ncbi:MAG: hypothetical protein H7098_03095, partial [Oligoflexus sp.]|nr:hypothetical protein [Pseudopedobacter sp.]